ncbi:MAG TPA: AI-2E family transporter [Prevotellaceae bacterium]|nr:AI-2E family transporter [Prevotellaceae bacterium]
MQDDKITFDRVARWGVVIVLSAAAVWLVNRLSTVLLPFFAAWLLAYMLYPLVHFLQYRLHLPGRVLSILVAFVLVCAVISGTLALVIPPIVEESVRMGELTKVYFHDTLVETGLIQQLEDAVAKYTEGVNLLHLAQQSSFMDALQSTLIQVWTILSGTINFALGVLGCLIVLLYMFFILNDYEKLSSGWVTLIPKGKRPLATMIVQDVKSGMNAYFRGQALIALCVGILFSIGFLIIDFPMAIGLGLFIGLLNLVPYLQTVGFLPTLLLAFIKSQESGQSFWVIMACALAVFAVVQGIQDMILTPRIMGRAMGLKPAVILLSLSVWGSLLGFIGLIIALPLTTLLLSYYRRFVLKESPVPAVASDDTEHRADTSTTGQPGTSLE